MARHRVRLDHADDATVAGKLYGPDRHAPDYGNPHHHHGPPPRNDGDIKPLRTEQGMPVERLKPGDDPTAAIEKLYRYGRHYPDKAPHDAAKERTHPPRDTFQPEDVPAERNKGHIGVDVYDQRHPAYQKPQAPESRQAPEYDNDATGWVRGMGSESPYPKFDHGPSGHRYRK